MYTTPMMQQKHPFKH